MKIIIFSTRFEKQVRKLDKKIIVSFKERVLLFEKNEFDPLLNNHKLKGEYDSCRSINITGDFRLIYEKVGENTYLFITIGSHSELYS